MRTLSLGIKLVLLLVLAVLLTSCGFAHKQMNKEFFRKGLIVDRTPADMGLDYETVPIPVGSRVLHAWFVSAPDTTQRKIAVLVYHGVGETVSDWVEVMKYLHDRGISSMVFDYSAYGRSTGEAEVSNLREDARAAFQAFQRRTPPDGHRFLIGFSMGVGIVLESVEEFDACVDGLVLIGGWGSWKSWLVEEGHVSSWIAWLLPNAFDNQANIARVTVPILIAHGGADDRIPPTNAIDLYRSASGPAELAVLEGMTHAPCLDDPARCCWTQVVEFLISTARRQK